MRAGTQASLMMIGPGIGIIATVIDGATSGEFSIWNVIAIVCFALVIGAGLRLARRVP